MPCDCSNAGTLVPGCQWHARADEDAEVVRRAVEHLRTVHGEEIIRENMVENIKARIRDENERPRPDPGAEPRLGIRIAERAASDSEAPDV